MEKVYFFILGLWSLGAILDPVTPTKYVIACNQNSEKVDRMWPDIIEMKVKERILENSIADNY